MKQNLARNLYEEKTGEGLGRSVAARVSPTAAGSCPDERGKPFPNVTIKVYR